MQDKAPILVVEDEGAIRLGLCEVLAYHGFAPTGVADGESGLREGLRGCYRLLILDVMLPLRDGFSICREVRARAPRQGILMLTAKGAEDDVLEGFRCGADDYVGKPFSIAQLMARVAALVRRAEGPAPTERPFAIAALEIDPLALRARHGGREIDLSRRDVDLLALFAARAGHIVSRVALLEQVWGFGRGDAVETRCIDMHIVKLRRKLGEAFGDSAEGLIETVRGEGYRVAAPRP